MGKAVMRLVNYGSPVDMDFPARIQGVYTKAVLLRPEAAPLELKAARRGNTTEIRVPDLRRAGLIVFS